MTDVADLLVRHWGLHDALVDPLGGGMNSETWLVDHGGTTYVAKRVAQAAVDDLVAGCRVARRLADAGLRTGPPVATLDGQMVLVEHGLALLEVVPGRKLEGRTDEEQRWIAETLAAVHRAEPVEARSSTATFMTEWLSPDAPDVAALRWLAAVVSAIREETDAVTSTWSTLHTDPAPEAFVHDDATGETGLIDWAGARAGPVLYDVASAVMYLGGTGPAAAFLESYRRRGPLAAEELELLDAFRRFRWAVQAAYFARRLTTRDLTGDVDDAANQKGLDDARRGLTELGVDVT